MEKPNYTTEQKEQLVMITNLLEQLNYLILSMGFGFQLTPQHFDFMETPKNENKTNP